MPTSTHHAIAGLVSSGHVRVIFTINFDRLMERALEAVGINPSVIDSPDKIEGAMPLTHSTERDEAWLTVADVIMSGSKGSISYYRFCSLVAQRVICLQTFRFGIYIPAEPSNIEPLSHRC